MNEQNEQDSIWESDIGIKFRNGILEDFDNSKVTCCDLSEKFMMGEQIAYEKIYLQLFDDEGDCVENSFCCDKIYDNDVEYIRADLVPRWRPIDEYSPELGEVLILHVKNDVERVVDLGTLTKKGWVDPYYNSRTPTHFMDIPKFKKFK